MFYCPEELVTQVTKDFMPRLKDNSKQALIAVLSKQMPKQEAVKQFGGTRQGLDKNILKFKQLLYKIYNYTE